MREISERIEAVLEIKYFRCVQYEPKKKTEEIGKYETRSNVHLKELFGEEGIISTFDIGRRMSWIDNIKGI